MCDGSGGDGKGEGLLFSEGDALGVIDEGSCHRIFELNLTGLKSAQEERGKHQNQDDCLHYF